MIVTTVTTTNPAKTRRRNGERGIALLLTLVLIVAMLGMGFLAVYLSSSSVGLSTNLGARQAAMNAALAGVQHARLVLAAVGTSGNYGSCTNATAPWSCVLAGRTDSHNDLPTSSNPAGKGAILYDGNTALYAYASPAGTSGSSSYGTYTVWVRNNAAEISTAMASGTPNTALLADTDSSLIIRVLGSDRSGTAQVAVEAATSRVTSGTTTTVANSVFGKNIDPYGSNAITGSFHF